MKDALPNEMLEKLKSVFPGISKKMTIEEIMVTVMATKAITTGDVAAFNALMDNAYGRNLDVNIGIGLFEHTPREQLEDSFAIDVTPLALPQNGSTNGSNGNGK